MSQPQVQNPEKCAAYDHLAATLPDLRPLFAATEFVALPAPSSTPVEEALAKIVVGQMLSGAAADTIHARLVQRADRVGCASVLVLPEVDLRACGLSGRKAKTFAAIVSLMRESPGRLDSWRSLPFHELRAEVASVWGLSDWSAAMLGIFHFGLPDILPISDGSVKRALGLVEERYYRAGNQPDYSLAAPFRSYLALTLWAALDGGLLSTKAA